MTAPVHLERLAPEDVRAALARDPRLLVPVGTCEQHGPHLPLGCDSIIVERLADDVSRTTGVMVAPTVAYGVNTKTRRSLAGNAAVRRKTLHRWMNDLLGSWEEGGVSSFIILTAHGEDAHQEALTTLRPRRARVLTVDAFALDFTGYLDEPTGPAHGGELDTSLLLHLAPELVRLDPARPTLASAEKGARIYNMIYERILTRALGAGPA
jgi:creatinine amidohydrolase